MTGFKMKTLSRKIILLFLLTTALVACGGGGGSGSDDEMKVLSVNLTTSPPSTTYDSVAIVTGDLVVRTPPISEIGDSYFENVRVNWQNRLTGQSGFEDHYFSGKCVGVNAFVTVVPECRRYRHSSNLSIPVDLEVGTNRISVEAQGKQAIVEIVRLDDKVAPQSPGEVWVAASNGGAEVSWKAVSFADTYNIYYASTPGISKSNYTTLPNGTRLTDVTSRYDVSGLDNNQIYYFIVTAENVWGESSASSEKTTSPPSVPRILDSDVTESGVNLTWSNLRGTTSYNVYFATSPGVTKTNYSTLPGGTRVTASTSGTLINGLVYGTPYYFVVTTVNWLGESAESLEIEAIPMPVHAPLGVKGVTGDGEVTVTWEPLSFATSYNLYLATERGINKDNYGTLENGQKITNVTSPYLLSGLQNNAHYFLVIEAESAIGEVPNSLELRVVSGNANANGWTLQTSSPTGYDLEAVEYFDSLTGWATGKGGTILKTVDGGINWSNQWQGVGFDFLDVAIVDASNVWVLGRSPRSTFAVLLNSDDGGQTWAYHATHSGTIFDLEFDSGTTGWIVGPEGILFWDDQAKSWLQKNDLNCNFLGVIDSDSAFVDCSGGGYLTIDRGETWIQKPEPPVYALEFTDTANGWGLGYQNSEANIYFTGNLGNTWNSQTSFPESLHGLSFSDSTNGWAVGETGTILHTNSGGALWSPQTSGTSQSLQDVHTIDPTTAWAVGRDGVILKTEDAGLNWVKYGAQPLASLGQLNALEFLNPSTGWVVGKGIAMSSDAGINWSTQLDLNSDLNDIDFVNATTGWAVGENSEIHYTSDGGNNWISQDSNGAVDLNGVSFVDTATGWAVGATLNQQVIHTADSGTTWSSQCCSIMPAGVPAILNSVHFVNSSIGWAVGDNGTILNTLDGGVNWNSQYLPSGSRVNHHFRSVFALDTSTIWVAGGGKTSNPFRSTLTKSVNGGFTWTNIYYGGNITIESVYFVDSMNGWIAERFGEVYVTQDGGNTWEKQLSSLSDHGMSGSRLLDIQFTDLANGFFVGRTASTDTPMIFKSTTGGFAP